MRVVLIKSQGRASWESCVQIYSNLIAAYTLLHPKILEIECSKDQKANLNSIKLINAFDPDAIVFIDHVAQTFEELIQALILDKKIRSKKPKIVFHLYGNFTFQPKAWGRINQHIKGYPAIFLCASERQSELVRSFMRPSSASSVLTCPFPINTELFHFDARTRKKNRQRMNWTNDFILLYAGRISTQKNVLPMINFVLEQTLLRNQQIKIVLAGKFDTLNCPLFRGAEKPGHFYKIEYINLISKLPLHQKNRIQFIGYKSQEELARLYNAADVFSSWSLHHDEDFGMAPAEALATGLPSILTDWGGYADFQRNNCSLVPVQITQRGLEINSKRYGDQLEWLFQRQKSVACCRQLNAEHFAKKYSISAVSRHLKQTILQNTGPFDGFSSKLALHASLLKSDFDGSIYSHSSRLDPYYFLNYSHYTR